MTPVLAFALALTSAGATADHAPHLLDARLRPAFAAMDSLGYDDGDSSVSPGRSPIGLVGGLVIGALLGAAVGAGLGDSRHGGPALPLSIIGAGLGGLAGYRLGPTGATSPANWLLCGCTSVVGAIVVLMVVSGERLVRIF